MIIIDHIAHGLLILTTVFFSLPAILAVVLNIMSGGKSESAMALRLIHKGLHAILHAVITVAEATAAGIATKYPNQEKWLKPSLQMALTALFVLGGLYLLSTMVG